MIDTQRIATGYDVEVLLGAGYFLPIFQAAHDVGELPSRFSIPPKDGQGPPTLVEVDRPSSADILDRTDANLSVTAHVRSTTFNAAGEPTERELDVTVECLIEITEESVSLSVVGFDAGTRSTLLIAGISDEDIEDVEEQLSAANREIQLDLTAAVPPVVARVVRSGEGNQRAIAIYLNLDLKIAPQSGPPETSFIPRGDAELGLSFLPPGEAFAIGVSPATFERFANNSFHSFFVEDEDGKVTHPVLKGGEIVGDYKSIEMRLQDDGTVRITIRLRGSVAVLPDVPVKIEFDLRPTVNSGKLGFDVELVSFDADAGLLNDILGYLAGGALAVIAVAIFGPASAIVLVPLLQAGGIASVEILASRIGDRDEDSAEDQASDIDATVTEAFSAFPTELLLFVDERDTFFSRTYVLASHFNTFQLDRHGFGMAGSASIRTSTRFPLTSLVARARGDSEDSRFGLQILTYRIANALDFPLTMREVLRRIGQSELAQVALVPTHIRRADTIVTDIKFDSGVDFTVAEVIALHEARVLRLPRLQVIDPKGANPYVRSAPDGTRRNNLESLPGF